MRERMRRACDEIWILDLGGEGRGTRREDNVFAIQTPVAIAVAVRVGATKRDVPATVHYGRISGDRVSKLASLAAIKQVDDVAWQECPTEWHAPFLPTLEESWSDLPAVVEVFPWTHSGVQVKRTWPIAPDPETLRARWEALLGASDRSAVFRETRDRTVTSRPSPLTGVEREPSIDEVPIHTPPGPIVRYGYRPFDRQWLIADPRVADYPRPELWRAASERQIYMVSFLTAVLDQGPAAVATAYVPDLHHFRGSFGGRHVIPLYRDAEGSPNLASGVLDRLAAGLDRDVSNHDVFVYAYALLSSPRYVERFFDELRQPGPRLPVTRSGELFRAATELGSWLLWVHTYGQRMTGPERLRGAAPRGEARLLEPIGAEAEDYPASFSFDVDTSTIRLGAGSIGPVAPEVWDWSVSGYPVIAGWLRYRTREGTGRSRSSGSELDRIRATSWPARYTTELLELLWLLEATLGREPEQAALLDAIADGPLFRREELLGDA